MNRQLTRMNEREQHVTAIASMKIVFFGASGMVGQGVLRECLLDSEVQQVLVKDCGRGRPSERSQ